jgi:putative two-component system response regulator
MAAPSPRAARGPGRILVVDDMAANIRLLERLLTDQGYHVTSAGDGEAALDAIARDLPDLVLSDVRMPKLDGFDLCRTLRAAPLTRLLPIVLMTATTDPEDRLRAIEAGATDFIMKPVDQAELRARVRSLMQLKRFTDDLDSAEAVLRSLALMIEARDRYTEGHCERLARYGAQLGQRLGLGEADIEALARGGYFHDIGKIALPDSILLKPAALTPEEIAHMRQHPVVGDRLCGDLRALHDVRPIVRHHHERLDGSGYPDGLQGDAVPLLAQLVGIVDVFDALTTARAYRGAMPVADAISELRREVQRGWRRGDLVEAFAALVAEQPAIVG